MARGYQLRRLSQYALLSALLYAWCAGTGAGEQLAAAAVVGAGAAVAAVRVATLARLTATVRAASLGIVLERVPGQILRDLALLGGGLVRALRRGRRPTGRYVTRPFDAGGAGRDAAGRRALVFGALSLPPNTFAIAVRRDRLLLHRLVAAPRRRRREWPL